MDDTVLGMNWLYLAVAHRLAKYDDEASQAALKEALAKAPTPEKKKFLEGIGKSEVVIQSLIEGAQGERIGLKAGDVVLTYDGKPIVTSMDLIRATAEAEGKGGVTVIVRRNGEEQSLEAKGGRLGAYLSENYLR